MTIAVDFDGTIVEHRYPRIGREIPFATDTLKLLQQDQHRLILWSVREGELLEEAVAWCKERGVEFYAVNRDYPEEKQQDCAVPSITAAVIPNVRSERPQAISGLWARKNRW